MDAEVLIPIFLWSVVVVGLTREVKIRNGSAPSEKRSIVQRRYAKKCSSPCSFPYKAVRYFAKVCSLVSDRLVGAQQVEWLRLSSQHVR